MATVRHPETARAYHELARENVLPLHVRLQYHATLGVDDPPAPLGAARALGLVSGAGSDSLRLDSLGIDTSGSEQSALTAFVEAATEAGLRISARADDGAALDRLLAALDDAAPEPHIRYDEPLSDGQLEAIATFGATMIGNPGRLGESGTPARADGPGSAAAGLPFGRLAAAGIPFAFGSSGFRLDPLRAIERATSSDPDSRLAVTEALEAVTGDNATSGASGPEVGSLAVGSPAGLVVLSDSPWETPITELSVEMTVVDGRIRYESG